MNQTYDVLVTGNYSLDLIFTGLPGLPEMGKEVMASGFGMIPGESYTSAVALHRLGLKVAWAADFGNDDFSRFAIQQARLEGLDDSFFIHHDRPLRRISIAASFPHDRSFITYYDPDPAVSAALNAIPGVSARVIYLPGFYHGRVLSQGLQLARAQGMVVVMDANSSEDLSVEKPSVQEAIAGVDLLLPNAREARCLTGEADPEKALHILGRLCPFIIIKDGPNGAHAIHDGRVYHSPAIPVDPVDTTGAGDCFNAGFLRAWLDGLPIESCLRWGNVVGGLSTLARGALGRRITPADVQPYLT